MAKGSRGGQRGAGGGGAIADTTQVATPMGQGYSQFMTLDDDGKADMIENLMSQGVPDHLADNDFQKFIYNAQMNDRPQLVDDATLDSMNGTEIFRTVNNVYDRQHDISYSADQIAKQVQTGKATRVSDSGGSYYGRGIYFADTYSSSASGYGNNRGDIKKTAVMRAKLNSNAKIGDYNTLENAMYKEISSGSKLGKTLSKADHASAVSLYALSKGYNVLSSGHGYFNILNRNAVTMSKDVRAMGSGW
jgi:hypothetical protein